MQNERIDAYYKGEGDKAYSSFNEMTRDRDGYEMPRGRDDLMVRGGEEDSSDTHGSIRLLPTGTTPVQTGTLPAVTGLTTSVTSSIRTMKSTRRWRW